MSDNENGHNGEEHAEKKRRVSEEGDGGGEGAGGEPKPEPGSAEHINVGSLSVLRRLCVVALSSYVYLLESPLCDAVGTCAFDRSK